MRSHRALLAVPLLVLATGVLACGGGGDDDPVAGDGTTEATGPSEPGGTTVPPADEGEVVPAEVVLLAEGADADPDGAGPGLLVDGVDLRAFAGRFLVAGDDAAVRLWDRADDVDRTGGGGTVYVGDVVSSGCFAPTGVELRRVDDDLRLVPLGLEDQAEVDCARAITTVALVAVPRDALPDDPTLAGEPAGAPVGPGRVVALEPVGADERTDALEVTTLGQLASFLDDLEDGPTLDDLGLAEVRPDSRRFVFVVDACEPVTAELVIDGESIVAEPRQEGEEQGRGVDCEAEEPYLVVADVKASASGGVLPEEGD